MSIKELDRQADNFNIISLVLGWSYEALRLGFLTSWGQEWGAWNGYAQERVYGGGTTWNESQAELCNSTKEEEKFIWTQ